MYLTNLCVYKIRFIEQVINAFVKPKRDDRTQFGYYSLDAFSDIFGNRTKALELVDFGGI